MSKLALLPFPTRALYIAATIPVLYGLYVWVAYLIALVVNANNPAGIIIFALPFVAAVTVLPLVLLYVGYRLSAKPQLSAKLLVGAIILAFSVASSLILIETVKRVNS